MVSYQASPHLPVSAADPVHLCRLSPARLRRLGKAGKDVPSHEIIHHQQDIRTGGGWGTEIRETAKNEVYWGEGTYLEVRPPEKLVFTWSWHKEIAGAPRRDMHPESPVTEVTVEFFDRGRETELVLTHRGLGSEKLHKEQEGGWNGCLNELENSLARARSSRRLTAMLGYAVTPLTSFRAANPNISRVIPVISRFTPNKIPMAQTELDGQ